MDQTPQCGVQLRRPPACLARRPSGIPCGHRRARVVAGSRAPQCPAPRRHACLKSSFANPARYLSLPSPRPRRPRARRSSNRSKACGTPKRSAAAWARPGTGSPTACTTTRSRTSAWVRWGRIPRRAMLPAPTTPMRTGSAMRFAFPWPARCGTPIPWLVRRPFGGTCCVPFQGGLDEVLPCARRRKATDVRMSDRMPSSTGVAARQRPPALYVNPDLRQPPTPGIPRLYQKRQFSVPFGAGVRSVARCCLAHPRL